MKAFRNVESRVWFLIRDHSGERLFKGVRYEEQGAIFFPPDWGPDKEIAFYLALEKEFDNPALIYLPVGEKKIDTFDKLVDFVTSTVLGSRYWSRPGCSPVGP